MKIRQTTSLGNVIDRGILASRQSDGGTPIDIAFLIMLEEEGCFANHILGQLLKDWEVRNIKTKIEQEMQKAAVKVEAADTNINFYETLTEDLEKIAGEFSTLKEPQVNTMHLLIHILRDRSSVSSRVLNMYGITAHAVRKCGEELIVPEN